jgi:hypothetical protein
MPDVAHSFACFTLLQQQKRAVKRWRPLHPSLKKSALMDKAVG